MIALSREQIVALFHTAQTALPQAVWGTVSETGILVHHQGAPMTEQWYRPKPGAFCHFQSFAAMPDAPPATYLGSAKFFLACDLSTPGVLEIRAFEATDTGFTALPLSP